MFKSCFMLNETGLFYAWSLNGVGNMREKMSHGGEVIGLTLQLQKFSVGTPSHVRYEGGNTVLGHYDHLLINPVHHWLDFSPRMDWVYSQNVQNPNEQHYLVSHYPLKLLFPSQKIIGSQPGFAYEEWKNPDILLENNPCLTIVLLNLTDAYRKQAGDRLLPNFLQLLYCNCLEQLEQMRCCVLPSLGYSDFCILMAGSGWKAALDLVDRLHGLAVAPSDGGSKQVVVLSTDYMLPVCHQSGKNDFPRYFDGLQLMVRVNLCPGITAQHLANRLPAVQVYRTSGGSDCVLSAQDEKARQELVNFLLDGRSGSFVVDIVSTPHLLMTPKGSSLGMPKRTPPDQAYIAHFEDAVRVYSNKLQKHNRHSRQINALWELSFMIKNICSQPHTGNLRQIMQNLLDSFSYCLNRCAEEMGPEWEFGNMEYRVGQFSSVVGNFLSDLSRSDCFFMERDQYNHASVSSATGLLIAYNKWLNGFTHAVSEVTDKQNKSRYTFLVTSGGRDQTQTMEAFYFLDQKLEKDGQLYEKVPLVTQMSEMSLFDFSGTILRATHECMHFAGIRRRPERVEYLLTFVTRLLSQLLANVLLSEKSVYGYAIDVFRSLNAAQEVLDKAQLAYSTRWKKLSLEIEKTLKYLLNPLDLAQWNESQCLSKNVQDWMYNRLMLAFSGQDLRGNGNTPYQFHMNGFAESLYKLTQIAQRDYFEDCDQLCRAYNLPCVVFSHGAKTQMVFDQQIKIDETLDTAIQLILSRLLIGEPASSMLVTEDEPSYAVWELKFPYFSLITSNIYNVLASSVEIFKEAFADVTACEILGADFADYVLMHVFEDWDLKSALSEDMANTYRISAVLRLCSGNCLNSSGQLTTEARGRIADALDRLKLHGMPPRLDANELCNKIDSLLYVFNENEDIGAPLLEYLQMCKSDYEEATVKAALKPFADSYQAIRLLAIDPMDPDCPEKLLAMYNALINKGG